MSRFKMNLKMLDWMIYQEEQVRRRLMTGQEELPAIPFDSVAELDSGPILDRVCDDSERIRAEAILLLGKVGDVAVVEGLIRQLECGTLSTRWAAIHQLTAMGHACVRPLLIALTRDYHSANLREGVHHVLQNLNQQGLLAAHEVHVLHALDHHLPGIHVAQTANQTLISAP
jgi:hypothetical protein